MKIQKIIDQVKDTTDELVIITNHKTIKSIVDEVHDKSKNVSYGSIKRNGDEPIFITTKGVTVFFIDKEDVNNIDIKQ